MGGLTILLKIFHLVPIGCKEEESTMNLVTRSARKMIRRCCGDHSLSEFKANAHRANRARVKRTLAQVASGNMEDANLMPVRAHMITAYEVD